MRWWTGRPRLGAASRLRVLTPHPGEMARLTGKPTAEIQKDRVGAARAFATSGSVPLVLKGQRTLHRVSRWPRVDQPHRHAGDGHRRHAATCSPGMIAGLLAQFPQQPDEAVAAAVYLHGLAGAVGRARAGRKVASSPPTFCGTFRRHGGMEECAGVPHGV